MPMLDYAILCSKMPSLLADVTALVTVSIQVCSVQGCLAGTTSTNSFSTQCGAKVYHNASLFVVRNNT